MHGMQSEFLILTSSHGWSAIWCLVGILLEDRNRGNGWSCCHARRYGWACCHAGTDDRVVMQARIDCVAISGTDDRVATQLRMIVLPCRYGWSCCHAGTDERVVNAGTDERVATQVRMSRVLNAGTDERVCCHTITDDRVAMQVRMIVLPCRYGWVVLPCR